MIRIDPYSPGLHRTALLEAFSSNVPRYFDESERADFIQFIDENAFPYYVLLLHGHPIGCGGIALNGDGKVSMCWGMVHRDYHKQGFGKLLLEHRIAESERLYPGRILSLQTTQHSYTFFRKFGFQVIKFEKDFWAPGLDLYAMERE